MGAFKELGEGIADLSTLTVQTFSGKLSSTVVQDDGSVLDWENLMKEAKSSGTVNLEAFTEIKLDGDTTNFVASGIDPVVSAAHQAAFKAAQDYRQGVINLFKSALNFV